MKIVPLAKEHLPSACRFADRAIGAGYYSEQALKDIIEHTTIIIPEGFEPTKIPCSFALLDSNREVVGLRITYPSEGWQYLPEHVQKSVSPEKWVFPRWQVGYYKSLFIDERHQRQGWGPKMTRKSAHALMACGHKAVICHSWKESPGNSSQKYLKKMGFEEIAEYPGFWGPIDYICTRCGAGRACECTAIEMIKRTLP